MNANGTAQTGLTNSPGFDRHPFWGPEGNSSPTISATARSLARDSTGSYSVGSVSDAEDDEDDISVTVNSGASSTVNGVTVSGISVAASGTVSATIAFKRCDT
jgi:hypothetical protein